MWEVPWLCPLPHRLLMSTAPAPSMPELSWTLTAFALVVAFATMSAALDPYFRAGFHSLFDHRGRMAHRRVDGGRVDRLSVNGPNEIMAALQFFADDRWRRLITNTDSRRDTSDRRCARDEPVPARAIHPA